MVESQVVEGHVKVPLPAGSVWRNLIELSRPHDIPQHASDDRKGKLISLVCAVRTTPHHIPKRAEITLKWHAHEVIPVLPESIPPQSVFMNGHVHHYMRIASSTSQNCGISYFIFDDIASLAGSSDVHNVDPLILSDICRGLRNENPYCADLCFLGVKARARTEGINVIPRMEIKFSISMYVQL